MTKVRTILRKDRVGKDGRCQIYLLVSDKGKRFRYFTGFTGIPFQSAKGGRTTGDFIEETGRFRVGSGVKEFIVFRSENGISKPYTNKEANNKLGVLEEYASDIKDGFKKQGIDWTIAQLKKEFEEKVNSDKKRKSTTNFYDYAYSYIESKREKKNWKGASITYDALRSLLAFDKNLKKLELKEINKEYIDKYIAYCQEEIIDEDGYAGVRNSPNTIRLRLSEIRSILNQAIVDKKLSESTYPFSGRTDKDHVQVSSFAKTTRKRFISKDSLTKIAHTELSGKVEIARHLFLFSFHVRGINWLDMAKLTTDNIKARQRASGDQYHAIVYSRSKTDKEFEIAINEQIQREIDWFRDHCPLYGRYLLPIVTQKIEARRFDEYVKERRKKYNKLLQKMAIELELPEAQMGISAYWSRHSFAQMLRTNGVSIDKIGELLGHADFKTTLTYLESFGNEEKDRLSDIKL